MIQDNRYDSPVIVHLCTSCGVPSADTSICMQQECKYSPFLVYRYVYSVYYCMYI